MTSQAVKLIDEAALRGLTFRRLLQSSEGAWYAAFADENATLHCGTGLTMLEAIRNAVEAPPSAQTDIEAL